MSVRLALLALLLSRVWAADLAPQIALSESEHAWRAQHPSLTVALDEANPPLNFRRPDGSYAGISVDYLRLIAGKAGLHLELAGSTWSEALGKAMRHEVDAIMSASYKAERLSALAFTEPYCETPEALLTRNDFPAVTSLAGFAGKRVAIVAGTIRIALLRQQVPDSIIVEVANARDGVSALAEGRADAFFDDLPVIQTQIDEMMAGQLRVALLYFQPEAGAQRIGVRNNAPALHAMLDKAIAAITPDEHRAIRDRWLRVAGGAAVQRDLGLSDGERAWLAAHPVIKVACDPGWAPIEWRDATGEWHGISVDYLARLTQLLGVRFAIAPVSSWQEAQQLASQGQVEVFASLVETAQRRQQWTFTPAYASFPIAIFARAEVGYLAGLQALSGSRVAVVRDYAEEELLGRDHPGITLVRVSSTHEGLQLLKRGEVAAYVGGLLTTAYSLQVAGDLNIHVVGETPYVYKQSIAVRNDLPELQAILGKALKAIPAEDREAMWRRWVSVTYQRGADLSLLWKAGLPLLGLLAIFLYWNRRLSAEVRSRKLAESELIAYRDRLEALVRSRTGDLETALIRLRRLGAAIDQTADGVVLATPDGRIDFVNPAFSRITGIAAAQASALDLGGIGLPWSDEAVRDGRWRGRISGKRGDGTAYELEGAVTAVRNGDGRIVDLLADLRDITASRLIEERLSRSQKLEAVGTMAGGIAHDFNNILAAILGSAELADQPGVTEERRRQHMERIIGACERARTLVRQILTFARSAAGERRRVELAPVLCEALSLLRSSLPTTIAIQQQLADGVTILGDATRIHQIIMNLGTNAGLAMPDGGTLAVELARIEMDAAFSAQHDGLRPGPAARIAVRDSGIGMSREVQARIFEPFFTTRPQGQGTGLGLSVVHGIVRDLGGAITVYSEPGRGTSFSIILPLAEGAGDGPQPDSEMVRGGGERVLFVDDEPVLRQIAADMLGALGYRVTLAQDGQEALGLLHRDPAGFDLLITDTTMPRMTGVELVEAARVIRPQLPVVLCSGQGEMALRSRPASVRFLTKPMTMRELSAAIREALAG